MLPVSLQAAVTPRNCTSILSVSPALSTSLATSRQHPVRCNVLRTPTTSSRLLKPAPLTAIVVCGLHHLLVRAVAVSRLHTFLLEGEKEGYSGFFCSNSLSSGWKIQYSYSEICISARFRLHFYYKFST
jgi:hypothetical protein